MSSKIGVIAEDASDVSVIRAILEKYIDTNSFSVRKFVGNGCGKLRHKCGVWARQLLREGCEHILVFHDLDRNSESALRKDLANKVGAKEYPNSLIVIPIEELEAWLLSDTNAIKGVFGLSKTPKDISNCELIRSPKEYLRDAVWHLGKKRYLNTTHNQKIAKLTTIDNLLRCESFKPFDAYIRGRICA